MKHIKHPLPYCKNFLLDSTNIETTFFSKKRVLLLVLYLFTLAIPNYSFAIPIISSNSHNEQKMSSRLSSFLDAQDSITPEMKEKAIQKVIDFNKDFKITPTNESKTLRRLFFAVQETFLTEYVLYSSFFQTIDSGKYDCLTGSVLYAVFLEEIKQKGNFNYTYQIIQNPIHVFIKIKLSDNSEIIFESTSLEKGFIATPKGIAFYLQEQANNVQKEVQNQNVVLLDNKIINNLVTLETASALLYFNQGVLFFNQRKFGKSLLMAKNALFFQKNEAFYDLIILSLQELLKNNLISEKEYDLNIKKCIVINN
ncbi:hypothetical protein V9L05_07775 [Bernardetia sp. Wsw4-3y2]|uniref:hypothetical protein n=1 Tax=Bernardetia sp. Wsw4-3y2 TaxID=3127471 RepID=UPI0030D1E5BA